MKRWIMHVDMDAFFASVEQRDHPEWRGKAVIVGGSSARGVAATASYEARSFGVHSAMPISQARRLCPDGIFVKPRFSVYEAVSAQIRTVMERYAIYIEPLSLDEAFLDISDMGSRYRTLDAIGRAIREDIWAETGLTASAGIAPNKFLAKMASDMNKPDGLTIIPYGGEARLLAPLPIRRLWGVGEATEKRLAAAGVRCIGDVQRMSEERLAQAVGNRAKVLRELSFGIDHRPIEAHRQRQSVGDESTYEEDLRDRRDMERQIAIHSDVVAQRLREEKLEARTVTLKIRFSSFRTVTRSLSFETETDLQEDICEAAKALLGRISLCEGVRLIGVTASHLRPAVHDMRLFSEKREKQIKAAAVMDRMQKKFGRQSLRKGYWLEEEAWKQRHKDVKDGNKVNEEGMSHGQ